MTRAEAAAERAADLAEHLAALREGPTCMCERCGGEGRENAGYENEETCRWCHGTGAMPMRCEAPEAEAPTPEDSDRDPWSYEVDALEDMRRRAPLTARATAWRAA